MFRPGPLRRRGVEELELDIQPHRWPAQRALAVLDLERPLIVTEVVRVRVVAATPAGTAVLVERERQPEGTGEREGGTVVAVDRAHAVGDEADRSLARQGQREIGVAGEAAGHDHEL